jgi:protein involved in plasmid replication-relaxation
MIMSNPQQRLRKFSRDPRAEARLATRLLTQTSISVIETIERYRLISTSLLIRLVGGSARNVYRHLQTLYHRGLINRFCFFGPSGRPGEFNYFLDNTQALEILTEQSLGDPSRLDFEAVRRNREKWTPSISEMAHRSEPTGERGAANEESSEGRRYFLRHELMISRFHGALELACKATGGRVALSEWRQGPQLWNRITAPKISRTAGRWTEMDSTEQIAHRPDALFSLKRYDEEDARHYLYEADRKTSSSIRLIERFRSHFLFVVKHKRHIEAYGIKRVRAVLVETLDTHWAEVLRQAASHPVVSGHKPSGLFWFTSSEFFARKVSKEIKGASKRIRQVPYFLENPMVIFNKLWLTPLSGVADSPHSLLD